MSEEKVLSVTHTDPYTFRKSTFAGHDCAVRTESEVGSVLQYMSQSTPWDTCSVRPYAWRLESGGEGSDDLGDVGAGKKMLHLLQRWDVKNVVLVVTRHDSDSLHGGEFLASEKLGVQRYRIVLSRAKQVLEQCYLYNLRSNIIPTEANSVPMPEVGNPPGPPTRLASNFSPRVVMKASEIRLGDDIQFSNHGKCEKRGRVNRFDVRTP